MSLRGLLIAAPRSGGGKTTVTLGLMRAFRQRGLSVAGLKSGPDYIDPAFHRAALGRDSFNLDSWAMEPGLIGALAGLAAQDASLVLAEGSMGLFDGVPAAIGRSGASADIAAALGLPALLVLDASGQAQTAGAVAKGCATFDPRVKIVGVALNKIGSPRHLLLARSGVEAAGLKFVGALPKQAEIVLPERHLGLVQASETAELEARLDALAAFVENHLDLDAILSLAAPIGLPMGAPRALTPPGQNIAIARDDAFSFLYPHLLADWRARGAEFSFFSPLADEPPPQGCDAAWLPGGYPELHAGRLAGAARFLGGLRQFAQTRPVHGECGGYMVLGESLTDAEGQVHAMAKLLSVETSFAKRRMTLGYRDAILLADCALGRKGQKLRGHEFHYASIVAIGADQPMAMAADAYGGAPAPCGSRRGNVSGSFFHCIAEVS
ncbi:cobyrinate a,c-diamide synthase [uncultured Rhodoblastus sp.]|uniref:cobyrinate a,c-diamide synthase n=1 Tax=uncultured Rhodoblastus sp. TaxID=543037 RepID=UPI0025D34481|nr:cobyrinate a,c-diamide synthase [uncultured Rhodoblastus sp.]